MSKIMETKGISLMTKSSWKRKKKMLKRRAWNKLPDTDFNGLEWQQNLNASLQQLQQTLQQVSVPRIFFKQKKHPRQRKYKPQHNKLNNLIRRRIIKNMVPINIINSYQICIKDLLSTDYLTYREALRSLRLLKRYHAKTINRFEKSLKVFL